jgi:xylan 1,4-beta-xylosidase
VLEVSEDGKTWNAIVDRRTAMRDAAHDYAQLDLPLMARHVRITNTHTPAGGKFSLSGLRVFGHGMGVFPGQVSNVKATRDPADARRALVEWPAAAGADFYIVRYGIAPDKLFNSYQVYKATQLDIRSLNRGTPYWFAVDAINGNGLRVGSAAASIAP